MKNVIEAIRLGVRRRATTRQLAGFDDHLLRDLGLTRADVTLMMAGHRTAHTPARPNHE